MPGKPHQASFPEGTFTVKDGFGLDSEWDGLNPTLSSKPPTPSPTRSAGQR